MIENQPRLTSAEITGVWTAYMNDSMSKCVLSYLLQHVEDTEIKEIVQFSLDLSVQHIQTLTDLFKSEELPLPTAFSYENDVNLNAARLYTDHFMLTYVNQMARVGLVSYSGFISMSARKDIRNYFIECLQESAELYDRTTQTLLDKGVFIRPPYVNYPKSTDFVDNKSYLAGLNPLSQKRPFNTVEISHLFMNIQTNTIGSKLSQSLAQTSSNEKVQKWMIRGKEISQKHIEIFTKNLTNNDISPPNSSDIGVTDSTTAPFSDKLNMFHMSLLAAAGIGNYSTAAAASQRLDLIVNYERLSVEVARYALDGAELMIKNNWLEEPPGTIDKKTLTKKKDEH
ncbi:DUF3231 family protein [Alkalibacillus haloalkaliphilus]|uniref:DUF3231 family protein n=2 Tax=Bacillaceae TaxID=186817 RepID=A0A511W8L8_9BACI|nr:DUF3231 family protein [Alkalibacillus haloalkaliphilus]GEN46393.1 hypothetical protein AHA02nite_21690 [Alkalibacillus haloalkaliphilus]